MYVTNSVDSCGLKQWNERSNNSYLTQQVFVNFVRRGKRVKIMPHLCVLTPVREFQAQRDAYPYFSWAPQRLKMHYVPSKCRRTLTERHGVISRMILMLFVLVSSLKPVPVYVDHISHEQVYLSKVVQFCLWNGRS